jgi:hypothetical protein
MAANDKVKKVNVLSLDKRLRTIEGIVIELVAINTDLELRLTAFETGKRSTSLEPGLNKMETFNGERTPEVKDGLSMDDEHKMQSMVNAIKVLPPNFVKDGRHSIENVQAIAGFKVSPEMMDNLYSKHKHVGYEVLPA